MSKSDQIKHYSVRHEKDGTHAADGYTRVTGGRCQYRDERTCGGVPALVEIMCEREVNATMGLSIDKINAYEPILDGAREMVGQIVGAPERD